MNERIRRAELLSEQLDAKHDRERKTPPNGNDEALFRKAQELVRRGELVPTTARARAEARTQSAYEILELVIHEADRIDSTTYTWTFSAATMQAIEALLNEGGEG